MLSGGESPPGSGVCVEGCVGGFSAEAVAFVCLKKK